MKKLNKKTGNFGYFPGKNKCKKVKKEKKMSHDEKVLCLLRDVQCSLDVIGILLRNLVSKDSKGASLGIEVGQPEQKGGTNA